MPQKQRNKEGAVKPLFINMVECDRPFQTRMVTGLLADMERTPMGIPMLQSPMTASAAEYKQAVYAAMSLFLRHHMVSPGSSKMRW